MTGAIARWSDAAVVPQHTTYASRSPQRGPARAPLRPLAASVAAAALLAAFAATACAGPMTMPPEAFEGADDAPAEAPARGGAASGGEEGAAALPAGLLASPDWPDPPGSPDSGAVLPGVDVLLRERPEILRDRRVGLITNHTGRTAGGESTIDALHGASWLRLVALFGPEHGIRGTAEAGERVASDQDARTGLPIHSLYGETRRPTPAMLAGVDALVFDIQDIGTRYYTYVWTMTLAMESAAGAGIPFVVLDRPNPIGGEAVQGNLLRQQYATFVGLHPVPMRHGLTAGELARLVNVEFGVGAELHVVPVRGWSRADWYDDTALPWIAPSPNMPSLESAAHYPGTCLFEGTNLSVGRGTDRAFQQVGAPWLNHESLAERLRAEGHPGVAIEAVTFTPHEPGDGKFGAQEVRGIRLRVTDRSTYDPARLAVSALVAIRALHPDRLEWREAHFDRLAGTDRVRRLVMDGATAERITAPWDEEEDRFRSQREPYLIYR